MIEMGSTVPLPTVTCSIIFVLDAFSVLIDCTDPMPLSNLALTPDPNLSIAGCTV